MLRLFIKIGLLSVVPIIISSFIVSINYPKKFDEIGKVEKTIFSISSILAILMFFTGFIGCVIAL